MAIVEGTSFKSTTFALISLSLKMILFHLIWCYFVFNVDGDCGRGFVRIDNFCFNLSFTQNDIVSFDLMLFCFQCRWRLWKGLRSNRQLLLQSFIHSESTFRRSCSLSGLSSRCSQFNLDWDFAFAKSNFIIFLPNIFWL